MVKIAFDIKGTEDQVAEAMLVLEGKQISKTLEGNVDMKFVCYLNFKNNCFFPHFKGLTLQLL